MRSIRQLVLLCLIVSLAGAADTWRVVPLAEVGVEWPAQRDDDENFGSWRTLGDRRPYVVLDGAGEAYVGAADVDDAISSPEDARGSGRLAVCAPAGAVAGTLYVPAGAGMAALRFTSESPDGGDAARREFLALRERHWRALQERGVPGAAWFRHLADASQRELGDAPDEEERPDWRGRAGLADTLDLFNGGRALAENLQLDAELRAAVGGEESVALDSIAGITVAALDWKPLVEKLSPETDPLAAMIPADQHAVFFPSFAAMVTVFDRLDQLSAPALRAVGERAEDALTRDRYQRQLCLEVTELARRFGPQIVASVAITGADPYLRMGTDVAILFDPKQRETLMAFLAAKHAAAATGAGVRVVKGQGAGVAWTGVADDARTVSSYLAVVGTAVVVANSTAAIERLARTAAGGPALAGEPEYRFFRDRYRRGGDESALVVLSDATIRRWCSPAWRIADSRRVRAAAELARLHAAAIAGDAAGSKPAGLGDVTVDANGPRSSRFGTLGFMAPIVEAVPTHCTPGESEAYGRFRDGFQRRWRGAFDPIALRLAFGADGAVDADLTVMPLISGTEYRDLIALVGKARIAPGAGDAHAGTLLHAAVAIDRESRLLRNFGDQARSMAPDLADPFGWLGTSISVYADADPFWAEWIASGESSFLERNLGRLPVAVTVEVGDGLKAAAFLTALRAFADGAAPGMAVWETASHREQRYVRVSQAGGSDGFALCYSITPQRLVLTLSEDLLKRSIDRRLDGVAEKAPPTPWQADQVALRADARSLDVLDALQPGSGPTLELQRRSWSNLPILTEWRRRFPDADPIATHERLWHTRLVCPGGGTYVWNDRFHTMESTVFGHPGEPKRPAHVPLVPGVAGIDFGLEFVNDGLRARMRLVPGK